MCAVALDLRQARNVLHKYPPGPDGSHNLTERSEQRRIWSTGSAIALMLAERPTRGTSSQDQAGLVPNCTDL